MGTTPLKSLPYPELTDVPNVQPDIKALALAVDALPSGVPTVVNGQWLKGSGGAAVWSAIQPADIGGYPADATKFLRGDGTWANPLGGKATWASWSGTASINNSWGYAQLVSTAGLPAGVWLCYGWCLAAAQNYSSNGVVLFKNSVAVWALDQTAIVGLAGNAYYASPMMPVSVNAGDTLGFGFFDRSTIGGWYTTVSYAYFAAIHIDAQY